MGSGMFELLVMYPRSPLFLESLTFFVNSHRHILITQGCSDNIPPSITISINTMDWIETALCSYMSYFCELPLAGQYETRIIDGPLYVMDQILTTGLSLSLISTRLDNPKEQMDGVAILTWILCSSN